jgi:chromosome segregation ATPase
MKATAGQISKAKAKLDTLRGKEIRAEEREAVARRKVRETADKLFQCRERGKPVNMSEVAYTSKKRRLHADWEKAKKQSESVYWKFRDAKAKREEAERKYKALVK